MNLYLLRPIASSGLWKPWYDKVFGFVVRAGSEEAARAMAADENGDEGPTAWVNPAYSTCELLTADGGAEVVMRDFASA